MTSDTIQPSFVHVIFTPEGLPRWFGPGPVEGSEPVDLQELVPLLPEGSAAELVQVLWRDLLIGHCRVEGRWQVRPIVVAPPPEAATDEDADSGNEPEVAWNPEDEIETGEGADI